MPVRSILAVSMLFLVCGCGSRAVLVPKAGASMPPLPAAARTKPDAEALMKPSDQARPVRNDELLRNSEKRAPDRFDLPPQG